MASPGRAGSASLARPGAHRRSAEATEGRLGAAMILVIGAAGDRDGALDLAAVYNRDRAAASGHLTVAGDDQALEPGLPGDTFQLVGGLLEAGGGVRLVHRDVDGDRAGFVHSSESDQPAALVDNHGGDREIDALCFGVGSLDQLHRLLDRDTHTGSAPELLLWRRSSWERGTRSRRGRSGVRAGSPRSQGCSRGIWSAR